ncbi:MAG: endonuclease domain-containing protein [Burkholderiales bacterium]
MSELRRKLRTTQTDSEALLWQRLRNRQLSGYKFRRQHSFPPYVVDFFCIEKRLILEIDGGQHAMNREADERRPHFLKNQGFEVIRFWNTEVLQTTETVIERILTHLESTV